MAFKILPGESPELSSLSSGQTDQDWSGLYAQFRVDHALWYLTNHYDRGAESACLVSLSSKAPLTAVVIHDDRLKHSALSSIPHKDAALPLMQAIGQAHPHLFLALQRSWNAYSLIVYLARMCLIAKLCFSRAGQCVAK
ncbi:hypothetical protein EON65_25730 [archaeon]|nr:MAG: hypothetical protein EON65_25730 [archaeon]